MPDKDKVNVCDNENSVQAVFCELQQLQQKKTKSDCAGCFTVKGWEVNYTITHEVIAKTFILLQTHGTMWVFVPGFVYAASRQLIWWAHAASQILASKVSLLWSDGVCGSNVEHFTWFQPKSVNRWNVQQFCGFNQSNVALIFSESNDATSQAWVTHRYPD